MTSITYARYWHGNLVIFRPLLLLFNISQIRLLLFILFFILFIYFLFLLSQKFNKKIAGIFALSFICNGYFSAAYSLESSPIFLVMMIGSILLIKNIHKIKNPSTYFFVMACITNFVDFLTVPLITLGIPMLIYLIDMQNRGAKLKECIIFVIKNSIIWTIGYGATWMSKWIIYDWIFKGEIMSMALEQVLHRTQRASLMNITPFYKVFVDILSVNFMFIFYVGIFGVLFKISIKSKESLKQSIPCFIVAIMPLAWYIVLANHTIIHVHFTYRHMILFLCGFYIGVDKIFKFSKREL